MNVGTFLIFKVKPYAISRHHYIVDMWKILRILLSKLRERFIYEGSTHQVALQQLDRKCRQKHFS